MVRWIQSICHCSDKNTNYKYTWSENSFDIFENRIGKFPVPIKWEAKWSSVTAHQNLFQIIKSLDKEREKEIEIELKKTGCDSKYEYILCQVPNPLKNQSDFLKFPWRHDFVQDELDHSGFIKMVDKIPDLVYI